MTKKIAEMNEEARFEKGKPADPTKNMSPEDAQEWEEMNEKHKDKFKDKESSLRAQIIKLAYEKPELRGHLLPLVKRKKIAKAPDIHDVEDLKTEFITRSPYTEAMEKWFSTLSRNSKSLGALYKREMDQLRTLYRNGTDMSVSLLNDYVDLNSRVEREMKQLEKAKGLINDTLKEVISGLKDEKDDFEDLIKSEGGDDRELRNTWNSLSNLIAVLEEMDF